MPGVDGGEPHRGKEGGMNRKIALTIAPVKIILLLLIGSLAAVGLVAWLWQARR
jgi:hypothetical protein